MVINASVTVTMTMYMVGDVVRVLVAVMSVAVAVVVLLLLALFLRRTWVYHFLTPPFTVITINIIVAAVLVSCFLNQLHNRILINQSFL